MTKREMWKQRYEDHRERAMDALRIVKKVGAITEEGRKAWATYKTETTSANKARGIMLRCK